MSPFVSIIVPIYNVEKYIKQCVDSLLNQTLTNIEIILVNDGSTDNCSFICNEYKKKDKRIKVIHKENGGLVSARKAGLEIASGKYATYVDGDDWIEPNMYSILYKVAEKNNCDITVCSFICEYDNYSIKINNNIETGIYSKDKLEQLIEKVLFNGEFFNFGIYPAVWNKLFKRELLIRSQNKVDNNIKMGEDAACSFPAILESLCIGVINNKFLYHYRKDGTSMTAKYDKQYFERVNELYKFLYNEFKNKKKYNLIEQLNYYYAFLYFNGIQMEFSRRNKATFIQKCKRINDISYNNETINIFSNLDSAIFGIKYKLFYFCVKNNYSFILALIIYFYKGIAKYEKKIFKNKCDS